MTVLQYPKLGVATGTSFLLILWVKSLESDPDLPASGESPPRL